MIILPQKKFTRFRSLGAFPAALLVLSILLPQHIFAQTATRQPVPDPPPSLPSVSEYSLPPGEDTSPNNNRAEGPVEENSQPPAPVPSANTEEPTVLAPSTDTPPVTVAPSTGNSAPAAEAGFSSPTNQSGSRRPASVRQRPETTKPYDPPTQPPNANASGPEPGFSFDLPDNGDLELADSPQSEPADLGATQTASDSDNGSQFLLGLLAILLTVLAAGFIVWRRRTNAVQPIAKEHPQPYEREQQDKPRRPAPKIFSPPDPARDPEPSPSAPDGFVTTKTGMPRKTTAAVSTVQNFGSARPRRWNHLGLDFAIESAASTLMNAVVKYTVVLTNQSGETLTDLKLSGALLQANEAATTEQEGGAGPTLHQVASLQPGESTTWSGEIKLSLHAIKPIKVKTQALFIPLARFSAHYLDQDEVPHEQNAAFVVGQEHEPPRPKMAPFRLDLGPRTFAPIGHRPLLINR